MTGPRAPTTARSDDVARGGFGRAGAGAAAGLAPAVRAEQLAIDLGLPKRPKPMWRLPPVALLRRSRQTDVDRRQVEILGQTLEGALAAHGVETRLVGATVGPSVTRYELELGPGVKVQKVTALQRDIAYALAAADVRLIAPIPGRSAIGVEVPNRQRQTVALGDILTSPEAAAATPPPGGGRRPGHRRAGGAGQPGRDAPHPHRRGHRRRASPRASIPC